MDEDPDEAYRTCPECGNDCEPESFEMPGGGIRIAFQCPSHGTHTVIDPFEGSR